MKKSGLTAGILLLLLAFSCEEEQNIFGSIEGQWQGTLAEIRVSPYGLPIPIKSKVESFRRIIAFKADGTMTVDGNGESIKGTYQVIEDKLITDIDLTIQDIEFSGDYTIETLTETTLILFKKKKDVFVNPENGPNVNGNIKVTLHFERI